MRIFSKKLGEEKGKDSLFPKSSYPEDCVSKSCDDECVIFLSCVIHEIQINYDYEDLVKCLDIGVKQFGSTTLKAKTNLFPFYSYTNQAGDRYRLPLYKEIYR